MAELTEQTRAGSPEDAEVADGNNVAPAPRAVAAWRLFFIAIPLLFLAFLTLRLYQTNTSEQRAAGEAPPFVFTTFAGETMSLDDLRGKGVVLNFWASWCDPCRAEAELLEATWRKEQDNGIIFIGLAYLDQEPAAKAYLAEYDVTYPNGPDLQSATARRYGIKGVPETFFIDPEGKIAHMVIGPIINEAQFAQALDKIRP